MGSIVLDTEKFYEILEIQNSLNKITIGENWVEDRFKNNTLIRFNLAYKMEIMELVDSLPWKWWTKGEVDKDNLLVEAVDALHFMLSIIYIYKANCNIEDFSKYEDLLTPQFKSEYIAAMGDIINKDNIVMHLLSRCEDALATPKTDLGLVNSPRVLIPVVTPLYSILTVLHLYLGITMDDIYRAYITKATLNKFRYTNGYLDGTYVKMWGSVEDNKVALEIMDKNKDFNSKDLYNALETAYKLHKK